MAFRCDPNKQFKRGDLGRVGRPRIQNELSEGKPLGPVHLLFTAEDPKVRFESLVSPFRLSICLGVVGGADVLMDSQLGADILS